ncbi:MAG: hypothetical protein M1450_04215 [Patescibacteria group bacterium]|nr:hypothetical protein [Patescibacteria group bacterium]
MITIVHGDDTAASRKYFNDLKTSDSVLFDGDKVTLTDIVQILEGGGLFSDNKKVFIDDFFSKRKAGKEFDDIISCIKNNSKENDIFFWEGKEISKKIISSFVNANTKLFKLPQQLFAFLDGIKPENPKNITLFHEALKTSDTEMIFFMLIRQFRLLLAISDSGASGQIDEVKRLAPWQITKLKKQSILFTKEQLINIYKKLYEIDLGQKTGTLHKTLEQAIDILLLEI